MSDNQTEREEIGGPEFKRRLWEAMQDEQADRDILPRLKPLPRKMVDCQFLSPYQGSRLV